jgi:hypothetical protein
MQYDVVVDAILENLIHRVKAVVAEGWRPEGGITYAPETTTPYMQVIVK